MHTSPSRLLSMSRWELQIKDTCSWELPFQRTAGHCDIWNGCKKLQRAHSHCLCPSNTHTQTIVPWAIGTALCPIASFRALGLESGERGVDKFYVSKIKLWTSWYFLGRELSGIELPVVSACLVLLLISWIRYFISIRTWAICCAKQFVRLTVIAILLAKRGTWPESKPLYFACCPPLLITRKIKR